MAALAGSIAREEPIEADDDHEEERGPGNRGPLEQELAAEGGRASLRGTHAAHTGISRKARRVSTSAQSPPSPKGNTISNSGIRYKANWGLQPFDNRKSRNMLKAAKTTLRRGGSAEGSEANVTT